MKIVRTTLKEYLKKNTGNATPEQIEEVHGQNTVRSEKLVNVEDYHLKR